MIMKTNEDKNRGNKMDNTLVTYVENKIANVVHVIPTVIRLQNALVFQWHQNSLTIVDDLLYYIVTLTRHTVNVNVDVQHVTSKHNIEVLIDHVFEFERLIMLIKHHIRMRSWDHHPRLYQEEYDFQITWQNQYAIHVVDDGEEYAVTIIFRQPKSNKADEYEYNIKYDRIDDFIDNVFDQLYPRKMF